MAMVFQLFLSISYLVFIFDSLFGVTSAYSTCYTTFSPKCPAELFEIRYPFYSRLRDIKYNKSGVLSYPTPSTPCGYKGFEIKCRKEDGRAVINISNHLYRVLNIHYADENNSTLSLVDVDVDRQDYPQPRHNLSLESTPSLFVNDDSYHWTLFYNCSSPPKYVNGRQSGIKYLDNNYSPRRHSYAVPGVFPGYGKCEETVFALSASNDDYSGTAKFGFNLSWHRPSNCTPCELFHQYCYYDDLTGYQCGVSHFYGDSYIYQGKLPFLGVIMSTPLKLAISVPCGFTGLFLVYLYFNWKTFCSLYYSTMYYIKNKSKVPINVEVLLGTYGGHALQRYKYSDIKTMTYFFKAKLGQGGYGSVFKGTRGEDGRVVAVKILNESKGNGEEFVNEVVTIGRTNHINVVSLLGYCNEGKKRALVYEFMPNGSLEKFIYNEKTSNTDNIHHLGWPKLYQIAIGIARGLEYLHCRCNIRILHFDIKPHNILLDHDFTPKISDFGLAKLCPTRESVVSMIGTRGTRGYTAPEIGCRNLGGVSHKSDVYSYGMMVLEMIGGRKNLDVNVENISGIYFPHWIYNQLTQDLKAKRLEGEEIFKDETAKKMIIVALWCIQTHPANRPSMTKVVEMLEGSNEELQMPPNPSLDPGSTSSS